MAPYALDVEELRTESPTGMPPSTGAVTTTAVEVTLLGTFRVRVGGRVISARSWTRRHSTALVKVLAMSPDRSMHREQVIDALWPDVGVQEAAPRLHKAAHYARKILGHPDAIVLSNEAVHLFPHADVHIDMGAFQQLARAAADDGGVAAAKGALAAYGGELLPQDPYEPWADQHRLHLDRLYLDLLHQARDWHQALAVDPADELAHLALGQWYAERGDRRAALRQLDQLDRAMRHELGLEPSQRARDLRRRVVGAAPGEDSGDAVQTGHQGASPCPATKQRQQSCCATEV